jgi:CRP/FNR family transcriptional regulator
MHTEFEAYLRKQTDLGEDAISEISSLAVSRSLRRNETIFRAGEICRHKAFVAHGLLRTFGISGEGNEYILQFSPENSWTLDAESYDRQIPSRVSIGAVEPSGILLWKKADFDILLNSIPSLKKFSERLISRNMHYSRQRIVTTLSATPEEKYQDFVQTFPDYLSRLPLRMIASYLGISVKTLTRIRHAQIHR